MSNGVLFYGFRLGGGFCFGVRFSCSRFWLGIFQPFVVLRLSSAEWFKIKE